MGKIKKNRNRPRKNNPIADPNEPTEDEVIESEITPNELSIQAAKEQLQVRNLIYIYHGL